MILKLISFFSNVYLEFYTLSEPILFKHTSFFQPQSIKIDIARYTKLVKLH